MSGDSPGNAGGLTTAWSRAIIGGLLAAGVGRFFVSPGSRSTPLVLAVDALAHDRITVVVDERAAAFAALGYARVTGCPAVVLATSGTAPAHWYPAIIEADEADIPLVAISADRPIELYEAGASQTTDQVRMFGSHVRESFELGAPDPGALDRIADVAVRAVAAALAPRSGPVHVNARFRKPLEPTAEPATVHRPVRAPSIFVGEAAPSDAAMRFVRDAIAAAERPCIVAGPMPFGAAPRRDVARRLSRSSLDLARSAGLPVFAEATSGVAHAAEGAVIPLGAALEAGAFEGDCAPDLVIELGAFPVCSAYAKLAERLPSRIVVSASGARDPIGNASAFVLADATAFISALATSVAPATAERRRSCETLERALRAAMRASQRTLESSAAEPDASSAEPWIASEIARAIPSRGVLVAGNSLVVRDLEAYGAAHLGPDVTVLHQRGVAGIDGLIAGAAGARIAVPTDDPLVLVLGDVSAQHDIGSLTLLREANGALVIVIVNNGGGRIFEELPVRQAVDHVSTFDRLYRTPTVAGAFAHAARGYGIEYVAAAEPRSFTTALTQAVSRDGATIVEVVSQPEKSAPLRKDARRAARSAFEEALRA